MRPLVILVATAALAAAGTACTRVAASRAPALAVGADTAAISARLAAGRQVVRTVCIACHGEQPPAKTAPPFAMVAMHYRSATADSAEAVARIVSWVRAPAKERSLLPSHAIERFGLMPPLQLPDSALQAAATYVMSLAGGRHGMHGMHGMQGMKGHPGTP